MSALSNQMETHADSQTLETKKRMEKIFGGLDPDNPPEICPIRDILSSVTDKWSILIVIFLGARDVLRFNELKRLIYGISAKVLTERLKRLERDAYVSRKVYAEVPVRVEYQLTEFGYTYLEQLLNLTEWIDTAMPEIVKRRHRFDEVVKKREARKAK